MATQTIVPAEDSAQLQALVSKLSSPIVEQAQQFEIETPEDYEMSASFMQVVATKKKTLTQASDVKNEATAHPIVLKAYRAREAAKALFDELLKPFKHGLEELEAARKIISDKQFVYDDKRAQEKRELEARLAAEEKKRLDDLAAEQARNLKLAGEPELAEQVLQQAAEAPAPVIVLPPTVPTNLGQQQRSREDWKAEITDPRAAFEDALKNHPEILSIDPVKLNSQVRSQKQLAVGKFKGIRVYCERKKYGLSA